MEPCPSHSNFEGPLHPPSPLAFSAQTLPDWPADPDKHIGISELEVTEKNPSCLASSSFDLKCAKCAIREEPDVDVDLHSNWNQHHQVHQVKVGIVPW